jgi:hypothetical protein
MKPNRRKDVFTRLAGGWLNETVFAAWLARGAGASHGLSVRTGALSMGRPETVRP